MSKARQHDNSARQWESIAYAGAPLCVNNGVAVLRNIRIYPYSEILLTVPTEGSEKYKARGESNTYINCGCSDCSAIIPIDGPAKKYWITGIGLSCLFIGICEVSHQNVFQVILFSVSYSFNHLVLVKHIEYLNPGNAKALTCT